MLDMAALRSYIAEDSPFRAKLFIQRLFEHVDHLKSFPELGWVVLERHMPDVRELVFQGYRIIYRVSENRIDILTILHGSRDLNNLSDRPWEA
ncbi:MAG TPA: type II toxin-antitoxin system RelE/ParE family toxin [Thiobacillus sp.]|jgi:plasmid stabilization system protein ParE|nr:type II toxin-antitoxin system RelE/ParE family toxin [Thiobacillus sp.]